jgi:hypothetical protein
MENYFKAVIVRDATKEEGVSNTRPEPGRDWVLIVKGPAQIGSDKIRRRPKRRCS